MKPKLKVLLGESDFATLRKGGYHYVDKSLFIEQVITDPAKVLLLPRPRRFGKTLNLSTLRYFFEKTKESYVSKDQDLLPSISSTNVIFQLDRRGLFAGLQIEQSTESWQHFQKYPVIFLTLKDVKFSSWKDAWVSISKLLSRLYEEHEYLLHSETLSSISAQQFRRILHQETSPAESVDALGNLSRHLSDYYRQQVVILIDEYDTPIHAAYENDYYQEAVEFFRNFLSGAFKDNLYLYKGVMTGILRVARESLFSGLNNLGVYSLLKPEFSTFFGFTEQEVFSLTQQVGHTELMKEIKSWYNGYLFGHTEIYNPWSILSFLSSQEKTFQPYWVNTGGNQVLRGLLLEQGLPVKADLEMLLKGGSIQKPIDENMAFPDLKSSAQAIWSFLLFTGYLKAEKMYTKNQKLHAVLRLVNREIFTDFSSFVQVWFEKQLMGSMTVEAFLKALFCGDAEKVEEALGLMLKVNLSYHDVKATKDSKKGEDSEDTPNKEESDLNPEKTSGKTRERTDQKKADPESVYHGFVLGILTQLMDTYEVRSNRESGHGRPDILILPKVGGKPGVVMEFKVKGKQQTMAAAFADAFQQLEQNEYKTELAQRGASPIFEYAVVFSGKTVSVRSHT